MPILPRPPPASEAAYRVDATNPGGSLGGWNVQPCRRESKRSQRGQVCSYSVDGSRVLVESAT